MKIEEINEKELKNVKIPLVDILRARRNISRFLSFIEISKVEHEKVMQQIFNKAIDSYDNFLLKWLFDYSKGIDIFKLKGVETDDTKKNAETQRQESFCKNSK